ncbi:hypothetical protein [Novipirellula caenicola]|uniref:hypothetical protein n=1 Tax=Novipirellula caenicola TaxID=1536901 RepID=UPI0031EC811C
MPSAIQRRCSFVTYFHRASSAPPSRRAGIWEGQENEERSIILRYPIFLPKIIPTDAAGPSSQVFITIDQRHQVDQLKTASAFQNADTGALG